MSDHSPLPWTCENRHGYDYEIWSGENEIVSVGAGTDAEADAAFIVRACNAHDSLVAACEALLNFFGDLHAELVVDDFYRTSGNPDDEETGTEIIRNALAVVNKAKGE